VGSHRAGHSHFGKLLRFSLEENSKVKLVGLLSRKSCRLNPFPDLGGFMASSAGDLDKHHQIKQGFDGIILPTIGNQHVQNHELAAPPHEATGIRYNLGSGGSVEIVQDMRKENAIEHPPGKAAILLEKISGDNFYSVV
jgi:hypothetical protein